jgi:hypothetical protein
VILVRSISPRAFGFRLKAVLQTLFDPILSRFSRSPVERYEPRNLEDD